MTRQATLTELEQRFAAGDAPLALLFEAYHERLRRLLRLRLDSRLARRIDPSDVLQETFLEANRRVPTYLAEPPDERMSPFLWVRFLALERLQQLYRHHVGAARRTALRAEPMAMALELSASLTSPSQAVGRDETVRALGALLDELDEGEREILALRHLEGLSNVEAAQILGVSQPAASKRFVRALERLRGLVARSPTLVGLLPA